MMSINRKWKLWRLFLSGALVSMMFVVACGAATEVEEQPAAQPAAPAASQQQAAPAQPAAPSAPSQPAAQQQQQQAAAQQQQQQAAPSSGSGGTAAQPAASSQQAAPAAVPTPTTVAQRALAPVSESAMGPREAPSFADYWNPPTAFYGEPVYGGTLRGSCSSRSGSGRTCLPPALLQT